MPYAHRLIAHRGWQRRYPENTLAGIEAAIEAGAKHIEIDIQLTADHVAVLFHDAGLQRMCGVDKTMAELSYAQLSAMSAHEPRRFGDQYLGTPISALAALSECMSTLPDISLYAEIKSESLNHFGHATVLQSVLSDLQSLRQHCYVISFDLPVLLQAREAGWPLIAPVLTNLEQLDSDMMAQLNPEMVFCNYKMLKPGTLRNRFAWPAALYEIDRYEDAVSWFQEGAELVETFAIGEMLAADREAMNG